MNNVNAFDNETNEETRFVESSFIVHSIFSRISVFALGPEIISQQTHNVIQT